MQIHYYDQLGHVLSDTHPLSTVLVLNVTYTLNKPQL